MSIKGILVEAEPANGSVAAGTVALWFDNTAELLSTKDENDVVKTYASMDGEEILTNKTVERRNVAVTPSATPSYNVDEGDYFTISGLDAAITSMTSSQTGTPYDGQLIFFRILDDGTGRAITWGSKFAATGVALPTTTTASKWLLALFMYSSSRSKFLCLGATSEA
jgi:hypothetical protein